MVNIFKWLKQKFCDHQWSKYRGYDGKPHKTAHCLKCGKTATLYGRGPY